MSRMVRESSTVRIVLLIEGIPSPENAGAQMPRSSSPATRSRERCVNDESGAIRLPGRDRGEQNLQAQAAEALARARHRSRCRSSPMSVSSSTAETRAALASRSAGRRSVVRAWSLRRLASHLRLRTLPSSSCCGCALATAPPRWPNCLQGRTRSPACRQRAIGIGSLLVHCIADLEAADDARSVPRSHATSVWLAAVDSSTIAAFCCVT